MFRSAAEISSSDSASSSDGSDSLVATTLGHDDKNERVVDEADSSVAEVDRGDAKDAPKTEPPELMSPQDIDVGGHRNFMTSALLEFYCFTRAADMLNAQPGSLARYTRESPEVQLLGKRLYTYQSQFLSSHGVLSGGIERDELGGTRQFYRDNLDRLGESALEGLKLGDTSFSSDTAGDRNLAPGMPKKRQLITDKENVGPQEDSSVELGKLFQRDKHGGALEDIRLDMRNFANPSLPLFRNSPAGFPLLSTAVSPTSPITMSRYAAEFFEISALGRGSFGQVYHVMNHIDGQHYAVKKIPLSQKRLEQLQFGGENHLETIMKEIRTLARLEHANVVRYYGAWVEQSHIGSVFTSRLPSDQSDEPTSSNLLSHEPTDNNSFGIVFEQSEDSAASTEAVFDSPMKPSQRCAENLPRMPPQTSQRRDSRASVTSLHTRKDSHMEHLFRPKSPEKSQRRDSHATSSYHSRKDSYTDHILGSGSPQMSPENSRRRGSQATIASHYSRKSLGLSLDSDDAEIESIPRPFSIPSFGPMSSFDMTDDDVFTDGMSQDPSKLQLQRNSKHGLADPAVVLHIQMSLHPISLGSYLSPERTEAVADNNPFSRRHCYHLVPSLRFMLDIISGVEYLHSKGIVHRDLKPANIFLSSPENHDVKACPTCQSEGHSKLQYCHPRIGDFGLVADISHLNDSSPKGESPSKSSPSLDRVVGTEFYRPYVQTNDPGHSGDGKEAATSQELQAVDEKLDIYALGIILFELLYQLKTKMERQFVLTDLTRGNRLNPSQKSSEPTVFPGDFAKKLHCGQMKLDDGTSVAESLMTCIRGMLEPNSQQRWSCSKTKTRLQKILAVTLTAH